MNKIKNKLINKELSRRDFIKTSSIMSVGLIASSAFVGCKKPITAKKNQPNIVFVFADQLRYQSCGFANDDLAFTPNIDKLSSEGVNFTNAVSSMPVCSAYRASLFTGKYATSTGMVINELRMNTKHKCLAHCLTDAGYETGYIGKWHLYANEPGHHHDTRNSFIPPGKDRLGFDGYWAAYNFHHEYYNSYYHKDTTEKIYYGEQVYEPDAQTDLAINYINKASKQKKPFFLCLSYGPPHNPWTKENVPKEYYNKFKDVKFPVPPNYKDDNDPYGDAWSNIKKSPELIQEWMRVYYAMTANLDWNIGRMLNAIEKAGLKDNTIVIFTSDHGEMFGAHGRMKKNVFYDEAARVPLLMKWPSKIPTGIKSDCCFSNVDFMPTILSLINEAIPKGVEGMNLSHCALGKEGPEPAAAFMQNTGAVAIWEDGHEWRALRDKRFTYAIYRIDKKEFLFDNKKDPYQMKNLSDGSLYTDQLIKFRKMLKEKMETLNDTFEKSTWYNDHWIENRIIKRTATS